MERIKVGQVKRIKPNLNNSIERVKVVPERIKVLPDRIYTGGYVKDKETGLLIRNGELYKYVDGCYFKCWPDGNLKDQKTETHCCWFGKITRLATQEELREVSVAVTKQMIKCFPGTYYDQETGARKAASNEDGMIINRKLI